MTNLFTKTNFKCNRFCGECCKKFSVKITMKEIERIKKSGYREEEFLDDDFADNGVLMLKKDEDGCVFLKKSNNGSYSCKIYENRPEVCRKYPFFKENDKIKSCLPEDMYPNVFFKLPNDNSIIVKATDNGA